MATKLRNQTERQLNVIVILFIADWVFSRCIEPLFHFGWPQFCMLGNFCNKEETRKAISIGSRIINSNYNMISLATVKWGSKHQTINISKLQVTPQTYRFWGYLYTRKLQFNIAYNIAMLINSIYHIVQYFYTGIGELDNLQRPDCCFSSFNAWNRSKCRML